MYRISKDSSYDCIKFSQERLDSSHSLKQVLKNLDKARQDPHITAIFLDGRNSSGARGSATSSEIRQALEAFQKAGKKIIHKRYLVE